MHFFIFLHFSISHFFLHCVRFWQFFPGGNRYFLLFLQYIFFAFLGQDFPVFFFACLHFLDISNIFFRLLTVLTTAMCNEHKSTSRICDNIVNKAEQICSNLFVLFVQNSNFPIFFECLFQLRDHRRISKVKFVNSHKSLE